MVATNPDIIDVIVLTLPPDNLRGTAVEEEASPGSCQDEQDTKGILVQDELEQCFSDTLRML